MRLSVVAWVLVGAAVLAGCSRDKPSPRSPLDDRSATAAVSRSATPTATPPASATPGIGPFGTAPPTGAAPPTAPAPGGGGSSVDRELAVGKAIEQLAQWLGVQQAELALQGYDEQSWPNSCLGIERPDLACAQVLTPGVRVLLLDARGHPHEVRADAALRRFGWAPQATIHGTVVAADAAAGKLTVDAGTTRLELQRVAGTIEGVPLASLRPAASISAGYDRSGSSEQNVIAWLAAP